MGLGLADAATSFIDGLALAATNNDTAPPLDNTTASPLDNNTAHYQTNFKSNAGQPIKAKFKPND